MFDSNLINIVSIVEEFLGEPKKTYDISQTHEYNCRNCSDIAGVDADGKYNLCVNYAKGIFHCWKCEESGKLSKLIRTYGGENALRRYYEEVKAIRNARKYMLTNDESIAEDLFEYEDDFELPEGCRAIEKGSRPYEYLKSRRLSESFIKKFNIKYIGWDDSSNFKVRNRIIIPSYDMFGKLNYWVGRDYTGKSKLKYCNPDIEKKNIIFNEKMVNWYENVTLVEGVFDHMVVPNSIPLLGKKIDADFAVYNALKTKAMANINILLDDDAIKDAKKMYKFLNRGELRDRIRLIECRHGYDASLIYEKFGRDGILRLMKRAKMIDEFDLLNIF